MTDWPEWSHKLVRRVSKPTQWDANDYLKVEAGLHYLRGNSLPYFSVTGSTIDTGGCIHDQILAQWPDLAPVIALHLSDIDGMPMHTEGNGWYQLAGYYGGAGERYHAGNSERHCIDGYRFPNPDECLASFAEYVRISIAEAKQLAEQWRCDDDPKSTRRWFAQWIEGQKPRWHREAESAMALLDSLGAK